MRGDYLLYSCPEERKLSLFSISNGSVHEVDLRRVSLVYTYENRVLKDIKGDNTKSFKDVPSNFDKDKSSGERRKFDMLRHVTDQRNKSYDSRIYWEPGGDREGYKSIIESFKKDVDKLPIKSKEREGKGSIQDIATK